MKWSLGFVFVISLFSVFLNQEPTKASASFAQAANPNVEEKLSNTNITSVYLTWFKEDTSDHIGVNYISQTKGISPSLSIKGLNLNKDLGGTATAVPGTSLYIHSFKVENLNPNSRYTFSVGDEANGYSKDFKFRTMPSDSTPVEVIQGGDMSTSKMVSKLAKTALTKDTRALLMGGDLAYANGKTSSYKKWRTWFSRMNEVMITPSGDLIPIVLAIGNHETNKRSKSTPLKRAPFYFALFPQSNIKTHFTRALASHSTLFILDSGHIKSHEAQKTWLESSLKSHQNTANKLAMYHAPLYPSHRGFEGGWSKAGRRHWMPLFDEYKMALAFENHDHVLKRTYPLKNNQKNSEGTVYIGDGCWGTSPRKAQRRWYLKTSESRMHVWRIRLNSRGLSGEALGSNGRLLDEFTISH